MFFSGANHDCFPDARRSGGTALLFGKTQVPLMRPFLSSPFSHVALFRQGALRLLSCRVCCLAVYLLSRRVKCRCFGFYLPSMTLAYCCQCGSLLLLSPLPPPARVDVPRINQPQCVPHMQTRPLSPVSFHATTDGGNTHQSSIKRRWRQKKRAVVEDNHLKVRTHAAHALRAVRDARRAYGDQLPPILGGSLRGLRACQQRSIVADPTQMRQVMRGLMGGGLEMVGCLAWFVLMAVGACLVPSMRLVGCGVLCCALLPCAEGRFVSVASLACGHMWGGKSI